MSAPAREVLLARLRECASLEGALDPPDAADVLEALAVLVQAGDRGALGPLAGRARVLAGNRLELAGAPTGLPDARRRPRALLQAVLGARRLPRGLGWLADKRTQAWVMLAASFVLVLTASLSQWCSAGRPGPGPRPAAHQELPGAVSEEGSK